MTSLTDIATRHGGFLMQGAQMTLVLSAVGVVLGITIGLVIALGRISHRPVLSGVSGLYIDVVRSVPFVVVLIWLFYALPVVTGLKLTAIQSGAVALGIYASAYFGEVIRAGLLAVPTGESEAAVAQGMTRLQALRRVVLPIAVRKTLPPMTSTIVIVIKDSAIVSVLGVAELTFQAGSLSSFTFRPLEVLTVVGVMYVVMIYPVTLLGAYLHRRVARMA
ncbi:MAG: amino acid ABC transporter permease [Chloroflexi bacterium]|nr:amino acid ABC transporter permease [Chloroflexota bacterium]